VIFTRSDAGVFRWDLAAANVEPVFLPTPNAVVVSSALSPDAETLVMAYIPPPDKGEFNPGYTGLYRVAVDNSDDVIPLLLSAGSGREFYYTPRWSADGRYIYYGHYVEPSYFIERMRYPDGPGEMLWPAAFAPHPSPDGKKLVYLSVDSSTGLNNLYAAAPDARSPASLIGPEVLWAIDAVAISPDGRTVVFSADSSGPSSAPRVPWYLEWMGMQVAHAHSMPEDLYSVSIDGDKITRLTHLGIVGPSVAYSPDGRYVMVNGSLGVYVLEADGSNLTRLTDQPMTGSLQWVP
jgi:Tol biopolymer transport system component